MFCVSSLNNSVAETTQWFTLQFSMRAKSLGALCVKAKGPTPGDYLEIWIGHVKVGEQVNAINYSFFFILTV